MAKHVLEKLVKDAKKKGEVVALLKATTEHEIPPEVVEKLENKPKFKPKFLEKEAKRFGVTTGEVEDIAAAVAAEAPVFFEQRTWEVDADVKEHFRQLYEKETVKRHHCVYQIKREESEQKLDDDGEPIGKPERISVWRECGDVYDDFMQSLVHQNLHHIHDSHDSRTHRAALNDAKELNFPTREKGVLGALSVEQRRRYMADRALQRKLLEE